VWLFCLQVTRLHDNGFDLSENKGKKNLGVIIGREAAVTWAMQRRFFIPRRASKYKLS